MVVIRDDEGCSASEAGDISPNNKPILIRFKHCKPPRIYNAKGAAGLQKIHTVSIKNNQIDIWNLQSW